jgi:hypothetical protein
MQMVWLCEELKNCFKKICNQKGQYFGRITKGLVWGGNCGEKFLLI